MHYKKEGENLLLCTVFGLGLGKILNGEPYAGKSGFNGELAYPSI